MGMTDSFRASRRAPVLQVAKSAVAMAVAWVVAGWLLPGPPPVFAAIAALLVVQPSLNQSFTKAIERIVGVIVGVVIASALGLWLGSDSWVILLATVVALIVAWALRMTSVTANQVAISALLVIALGTTTPAYALDRVLETLIGAVIGLVVHVALVPPVAVEPARVEADGVGEAIASSLERLADALTTVQTPGQLTGLMLEARLMRPMVRKAETAIETATESLALNPRARRHRADLALSEALVTRYAAMSTQVIGMTRAVVDRYDQTIVDEPSVHAIADQLRRAAHDVRLDLQHPGSTSDDGGVPVVDADEAPALTAPLTISTPTAQHWVLVGSLLEDLRRIHEALSEPLAPVEASAGRR